MAKDRIIFIDDQEAFLDGLRRSLRHMRKKWQTSFFTNPDDALAVLKQGKDVVVVSDWMMPGTDGMALCKEARRIVSENEQSNMYFIFLTGKQGAKDVVEALDGGSDDYICKPFDTRELIARIRVGLRLLEGDRKLRIANERLALLATTDTLTGLHNRRFGLTKLDEEMARVRRGKQEISLMMVDVDHFKEINDNHGHDAGDAVLVELAVRMRETLRRYDVPIRWGGEEFLVICPHTDSKEIVPAANRLLENISKTPFEISEAEAVMVTVSIGATSTDTHRESTNQELITLADQALYQAKKGGRNCLRS